VKRGRTRFIGEPTALPSCADDPTSGEGVTADACELPDLLFANLFERPMDAYGTYRSNLDPAAAGLSVVGEWVYVALSLAGARAGGSGAQCSVKFNTDVDDHPDVRVRAWPTSEATWASTECAPTSTPIGT